jgi:hypothetical protein
MTMKPPAFADTLVNGFSVSPAIANEILGDLAEEWPERLARDGPRRASRWYWGQTVRAIPHLLRQWRRESPWTSVVGALAAAVVTRMLLTIVFSRIASLINHNGASYGALFVGALVGRVAMDMAFGGLIARFVQRTPLVYLTIVWVLSLVAELSMRSTLWDIRGVPAMGTTELALVSILFVLPVMVTGALLVIRTRERAGAIGAQSV